MGYPRSYESNGESGQAQSSNKFQEGDVVFLKSGSMPMTVSAVFVSTGVIPERVQVLWQNYYGEMRVKDFSRLVLTLTQPVFCATKEEDDEYDE